MYRYSIPEPLYSCEICGDIITNPICPNCMAIEVEAWSTLYPNLRSDLLPKIKAYLQKLQDFITESGCITCKKNSAAVCPYCFTHFVLKELEKIKADKRIIKEFLQFFNFDLDHMGYMKDAFEEGLLD